MKSKKIILVGTEEDIIFELKNANYELMGYFGNRKKNGGREMEQTYEQFGTYNLWKEVSLLLMRLEMSQRTKMEERTRWWWLNYRNDLYTYQDLTGEQHPFLEHELKKTERVLED